MVSCKATNLMEGTGESSSLFTPFTLQSKSSRQQLDHNWQLTNSSSIRICFTYMYM